MRKDQEIFFNLIEPNSKVIDIGCGEGELLHKLKLEKDAKAHGVELESERVAKCLEKGLSVIQGDADFDLDYYPNKELAGNPFDYVILANTLQVMRNPKHLLENAKRIGKKTLVSVPNFGHYKNMLYLILNGKMPVTSELSYEWYETPNIHFSTLKDFISLINKVGLKIEKSHYIDAKSRLKDLNPNSPNFANIFATKGIFVLG